MTELNKCKCGENAEVEELVIEEHDRFKTIHRYYKAKCHSCGRHTNMRHSKEEMTDEWNGTEKVRDDGGWWYVDNEGDGYGW